MGALQAILLADSITRLFEPITLECSKVPLSLVKCNTPMNMIDHTLAWLESADVEEVFVLSCSDSKRIIEYLDKSRWVKKPNFSVTTIESHNCATAGVALRSIHKRGVIKGDFVLVSGGIVTNMMLKEALEEHKERKQKDKNAVMTMIIKQSKPCQLVTDDDLVMAIDPSTKELVYYEDRTDDIKFNKSYLTVNPCLSLHNDKQDCYIYICSPQVLGLLADINVDYQDIRRDFVKGSLVDDKLTIFTHEICCSYYAEFLISYNPAELESDDKSEPLDIESDDKSEPPKIESDYRMFEKNVEEIFLRGLHKKGELPRTVDALHKRRFAYRMGRDKCASAVLYSLMKFALDNSKNSGNDLVKEIDDVISKWGTLLKAFSRGVDEQIQVILKFEEICLECMTEYAPLFVQVLNILYQKRNIQKEAILNWANDKEDAVETDKLFLKQSQKFIQSLSEQGNFSEFQGR